LPTVREAWLKLTTEACNRSRSLHLAIRITTFGIKLKNPYELEDLCQDIAGGHRIVQTVFVESRKMFKKGVPPAMQPVGETEFVMEVASRAASQSTIKVASGIVGFCRPYFRCCSRACSGIPY